MTKYETDHPEKQATLAREHDDPDSSRRRLLLTGGAILLATSFEGVAEAAVSPGRGTFLRGTGTPEGVARAELGSLYAQTNGVNGNTLWRKRAGGTGNTGWVLVNAGPYNVREFGAKGDGTTDDLAAFQSVIDAATLTKGTVFVPRGTYRINGTLNLKSNVTIEGESSVGSIISLVDTGSTVVGVNVDGVTVRNVKFDKPDQDANMLSFTSSGIGSASHNCLVEGCRFTTSSAAGNPNTASLAFYGNNGDHTRCRNMRALNNYVEYNHIAILLKYGHTQYQGFGNTCIQVGNDPTAEGTKLEHCENSTHSNNSYLVTSACFSAITIQDAVTGLLCCNNTIELGAAARGFWIEGGNVVTNILISNNFIKGDGTQQGIYNGLTTNVDVVIDGNNLNGCWIDVSGDRNHVVNNHVYGVNGQLAIRHRGTESRISGNVVRSCSIGISGSPNGILTNGWLEVSGNTILDFTDYGIVVTNSENILVKDNFLRTIEEALICIWMYNPGANARCVRNVLDCEDAQKQIEFAYISGYAEGNIFFNVPSSSWYSIVGSPVPTIRDATQQISASGPPVSGAVGDIVWNTNPTAGGNVGWVCVAPGAPATWKAFGTIAS